MDVFNVEKNGQIVAESKGRRKDCGFYGFAVSDFINKKDSQEPVKKFRKKNNQCRGNYKLISRLHKAPPLFGFFKE